MHPVIRLNRTAADHANEHDDRAALPYADLRSARTPKRLLRRHARRISVRIRTTTDNSKYTAQLGVNYFFQGGQGKVQWALVMAGTVVISLPLLIVFLAFQRFFVCSVATTGLKG